MKEYTDKYTMKTDRIDSVREQAKYEVGLEKFLSRTESVHSQTPSRICTA